MKKFLVFTLVSLLLISCKQKETKPREVAGYTIEQFMDNENVFDRNLSPDKSKLLVTSDRSGIFNMYTIDVTTAAFEALTQSDSASVYAISYFPADERILFRMDGNGDEIFKLFVKDGDAINRLTPAENVRALFYQWAKDKKGFYYATNERDPRLMDIYRMDIENFSSTLVYQNDEGYEFGGVSKTGQYIAFVKPVNTNDSDLLLYNTENK